MSIKIRHLTHQDASPLREHYAPDMSTDDILKMIDDWNTSIYKGKRFEMLTVLDGDAVVGLISLYEHSKSVASLGPETFSGMRNRGYAAEAMRQMEKYAGEKGYRVLLQQIKTDNLPSLRLHQKLGYETDGYVYRNRRDEEVVLYLKALG